MPEAKTLHPPLRTRQFRALADESRLRILALLGGGEHCVCELTEALGIPQPLLSFHLKTLKEAGLVADRRQGRWTYYALEERALRTMAAGLAAIVTRPRRSTRDGRDCE